jgi:hypothetical protein
MPSMPYPHPEERPKGASQGTQARYAAPRPNSCPASQLNGPTGTLLRERAESSECISALEEHAHLGCQVLAIRVERAGMGLEAA